MQRGEEVQFSPTGNPLRVLCGEGGDEGDAQCLNHQGQVRRREAPELLLIWVRTRVLHTLTGVGHRHAGELCLQQIDSALSW